MTIHKEGRGLIIITTLILGLVVFWDKQTEGLFWIKLLITAAVIFFWIAFLQFFRLPNRLNKAKPNELVAPCDGKVVVIEEIEEPEYFKDKRIQVSIFMSPINVHANWTPVRGDVTYVKYHPGKFLVAWHPKSSTDNERTTVVIENNQGVSVLFRQIAGALARRIVCYSKEGETAEQGEEFGFIKFGSRVDIFLPLGTEIKVGLGEVVKGGITVLAHLKN
jgi:phosphatidylserine decarboxylase